MAEISAKDVAALRKITGAGMMDCKKALSETDGDIERAKDWLREKGIAGAAKRAGREADQGAIDVLVDGNVGALVELNCETDFVAKGDEFKQAVAALVRARGRARRARPRRPSRSTARRVDDFVKGCRARSARRSSSAASCGSRRPTASSTRTSTSRTSAASSACSSSSAGSTRPTRRRARSRTTSRCTSPARRPGGSPATRCPADVVERERKIYESLAARRGQARAGLAQDRRGQAQRLLQGEPVARSSSSRS